MEHYAPSMLCLPPWLSRGQREGLAEAGIGRVREREVAEGGSQESIRPLSAIIGLWHGFLAAYFRSR
jgi:hypothetical protein